jgi:hypothetical protein
MYVCASQKETRVYCTADDDNSNISNASSRAGHGCRKDEEPKIDYNWHLV